tara:strand:+ start:742 stop:1392 length:651 start_codon:yes stop_codon:yes gene_type:complete
MSDPINDAWKRFLLQEGLDEKCNRFFDKDGHFTSKEKAAAEGGTYSISTAASKRCGDKEAKPGKMRVTKKGKLQTKFTLAQCGRTNAQTGDKKPKDKRCRDYPKGRYGDENTKSQKEGIDASTALPTRSDNARQEQPEERIERNFPGSRSIRQLARGIYEHQSGALLIRPADVDAGELEATWGSVLGEAEGQCPQHCVQQVLDLLARVQRANKGEQ